MQYLLPLTPSHEVYVTEEICIVDSILYFNAMEFRRSINVTSLSFQNDIEYFQGNGSKLK